jgi:hypothetical protein
MLDIIPPTCLFSAAEAIAETFSVL